MSSQPTMENQRYKFVERLGQGAQGAVDLVRDRHRNNQLLALKTLRSEPRQEWTALFRREFEVLAGMQHPRLPRVHDFGTTPDGHLYFTRDFVEGQDLLSATGSLSPGAFVSVCVEICRALRPLHNLGLVHGDLKPGNLIMTPSTPGTNKHDVGCRVHPIDFSFARAIGQDAIRRGTIPYMAPEIIEERHTDVRADLYALGITLFEFSQHLLWIYVPVLSLKNQLRYLPGT